jgi:hypothetical protein
LPVVKDLVAAADGLWLYEPFGGKADRTGMCGARIPGGAWKLDPASGKLTAQMAPALRFSRLLADRSGDALYGVAIANALWSGPVQLVRLRAHDGQMMAERTFDPGVLQIGYTQLATVPSGDVFAAPAR